jgi:hypothetical protein
MSLTFPSRAQGIHGSGRRDFSEQQYRAVVDAVLRLCDFGNAATVEDLCAATGLGGRAVRDIVSAADGVNFLLGGDGNGGYQLAHSPASADRLTARFRSQTTKMLDRLARRDSYARQLWSEHERPTQGELL